MLKHADGFAWCSITKYGYQAELLSTLCDLTHIWATYGDKVTGLGELLNYEITESR